MQLEKIKRKIKKMKEIHSMSDLSALFIKGDPVINVKKHKWHSRQNNA